MQEALRLAALAIGLSEPNPRVGCVIVAPDGRVIGRGHTQHAGGPHAEVMALRDADARGERVEGATGYVSLEPCSHHGRTPPCSDALVAARLARVVIAVDDPNPLVAGQGAARLRAAGIAVETSPCAEQARELNIGFFSRMRRGQPWVRLKAAMSLDGRTALADGTSQWITGEAARADVHRWRALAGAILVGTGTVLADDPALTVRRPDGTLLEQQPLRVVVGRRDIAAAARVHDQDAPTLQVRERDPSRVLQLLAARGIRQVWLEGGPTLAGAFLAAGLVDEVIAYLAPALLGSGRSAVGDLGISTVANLLRLHPHDVTTLGADIRVRASIIDHHSKGTDQACSPE